MAGIATDLSGNTGVDLNSIAAPPNFASVEDITTCKAEPFIDRDLQLMRCLDDKHCTYKSRFNKNNICNCRAKRSADFF